MDPIKRFFECLIPVTVCNLKCSYCYVIQRECRCMKMAQMKYTPKQIGRALTKERLGGACYFSICGAGETTMQPELPEIVQEILEHGHYVNITTNGTVTKQINKILQYSEGMTEHLVFSFSFHYLELRRLNLLDRFFENVNSVKKAGASFLVQLNLCDEYLPYLDEIKKICVERVGAEPQIAATRKEEMGLRKIELLTEMSEDQYMKVGNSFDSPLFDFTIKNFNIKRKEFCYAGDWSGNLNLATGVLRRCYCSYFRQDIFKNPLEPIHFLAIGNCCGSPFCMNSSHFMSLGVIPEIQTPGYCDLRNRENAGWYTPELQKVLNRKLSDSNEQYSACKKFYANTVGFLDGCVRFAIQTLRTVRKKK